ncbi:hypothetical protein BC835DRAFT_1263599 [Cytidiella melzeri]|nr:hypothetical protein BC835DRAFT_1263599 [Cytidiella melzeri]
MARKAARYGNELSAGHKLGRHLPRIASGDAPDDWVAEEKTEEPLPAPPDDWRARRAAREKREEEARKEMRESRAPFLDRSNGKFAGVADADDVAGIPGRLRLSKDKLPSAPSSPLPSSRLTRGLWADVQRNLLQAYEYLCHVGEAQQWIEGCLGEELGFGVVEMEEGMRNGVVLAKLVRVFQGEQVVRRIYEAPKLDFRHSDNINVFFNFVRFVGLPEASRCQIFIFELTDLYEKKNFPKVIYCIHALSHLLARRGLAERIGNLLGRLQFSDDQLEMTQKGLKDSGVAMPNFGNVGRELAKEINEEPDEEPETEEERRDRVLLENEGSIIATQATARAFLVRKAQATRRGQIQLAERSIAKFQARIRGAVARARIERMREQCSNLEPWVVALQAHARGLIARRDWRLYVRRIRSAVGTFIQVQAQARGVLQRRKFSQQKVALTNCRTAVTKLQSFARAQLARRAHRDFQASLTKPKNFQSIVALQAHGRGVLLRRKAGAQLVALRRTSASATLLQAHCRGVLVRRHISVQLAKLDDLDDITVRIQAAARTFLARKRLLTLIRGLRKATPATPSIMGLQAQARGYLVRRHHAVLKSAIGQVKVIKGVNTLQAFARAALARTRHREQNKRLIFVEPDVVGFQAVVRGAMVREKFRAMLRHYRNNMDKVVQIQSLFRAKETREQYRQLTLGTNVSVDTIKNFVHLLDDSEADFQEEIKLERMRQAIVKRIRENQALESHVDDLDVKIALVVQNVKSFEEVLKARRKHGADNVAVHAARASVLAAHGDPFAGPSTLDAAAKRKLELYQQLFYLLQTKGEYLARLFTLVGTDEDVDTQRKLAERVTLNIFGYGQDRREDYLLLKLLQTAIHNEIHSAPSIDDVLTAHPLYVGVAIHYVRPKQVVYVRETLQAPIKDLVESADEINLEANPSVIYRTRIDLEETRTGIPSRAPKDVSFQEALEDYGTRGEYIRHLQLLQWWTETFVAALVQSTQRMPYGMRYLAREALHALRERFPEAPPAVHAACIARLVYYRYINPAIMTPETFDIVSKTVDIAGRKNLAQISRMLTQITSARQFEADNNDQCYVPVNGYVQKAIGQLTNWLLEVANVPDAETQYHAYEFHDATVQPKSVYITPNEVYKMHALLSRHLDDLAPKRDDTLHVILSELDGVPHIGANEDLNDARDVAIELQLTNRFAHVKDPGADEKALWVQAKRAVLAILRVQPAKDLVESLMQPVTDEHELRWETILEETEKEQYRAQRRMPSTAHADSAYRLEDIRSMTFREVKAHAIFFLLELEKRGKISRNDSYQGILNAIAGDVRSKNRRRVQRQNEKTSMEEAMKYLEERKRFHEEQINSYHDYVEGAMSTMQRNKGKKRFVMPFTKQYFHMRELQKAGKTPQFGSYKYSAQHFYDKGILLSIAQFSPRQFDKIDIILSSNQVGVFSVEIFNNSLGITNRVAHADVKMEDLLQAQFENKAAYAIANDSVKFNLDLFLYQVNKK